MERKRRAFVIGVIGVIALYFCVVHVAAADEIGGQMK